MSALAPVAAGNASDVMAVFRHHGGRIDAARAVFPKAPDDWIDLSTGISPYAYPTGKIAGSLRALPSPAALAALEAAAARFFGASANRVVAVPGTDLALRLLGSMLPKMPVGVVGPGYGGHIAMWNRDVATIGVAALELSAVDTCAQDHGIVILANPNNPDGHTVAASTLHSAATALAARHGWLIVDEAFADVRPANSVAAAALENTIVLRSFGKFFGLAGLRLGFVIAPPFIAAGLRQQLGDWPISGPSIAVATKAYTDTLWHDRQRLRLTRAAVRLDRLLVAGGLSVVGGTDLFRLVHTDDAARVFERLASAGILVRPFASDNWRVRFGLPSGQHQWQRLRDAIIPDTLGEFA